MSAATVIHLPDRDACHRLSDLVAQLDGLARILAAGEDIAECLTALEYRAEALAEDVQARMGWVQRVSVSKPPLCGAHWGGVAARAAYRERCGRRRRSA